MTCLACSRRRSLLYDNPVWTDGDSAPTIQPQVPVRKLLKNETSPRLRSGQSFKFHFSRRGQLDSQNGLCSSRKMKFEGLTSALERQSLNSQVCSSNFILRRLELIRQRDAVPPQNEIGTTDLELPTIGKIHR